ncbi:MAG: histidine phosphatase family protein [Nitrospinales bacterium]
MTVPNLKKSEPDVTLIGQAGCRIYLIRHGETANAKDHALNGHFDIELSLKGKDQISSVAKALKDSPIRAIYSSDLIRTLDSAKIISQNFELQPICYPELRELSFGKWEGLSLKELNSKYPGEVQKRFANPETFQAEGGETLNQLVERVLPKYEEIIDKHSGEEIVIMSHGGVNRVILGHLLGIPLNNVFRITQENAGINIIQYYNGQPVIELVNGLPYQMT